MLHSKSILEFVLIIAKKTLIIAEAPKVESEIATLIEPHFDLFTSVESLIKDSIPLSLLLKQTIWLYCPRK